MSYLDLLKLLVSFGPKLKLAWPILLAIFEQVQALAELFRPETAPGELAITEVSGDELAAEAEIGQLIAVDGAQSAFDGSRLRGVFKWAKDAGLLDLLIGLVVKAATGG